MQRTQPSALHLGHDLAVFSTLKAEEQDLQRSGPKIEAIFCLRDKMEEEEEERKKKH
jgi:hypothetical protein